MAITLDAAALNLAVAVVCGALIGSERQVRQRMAGLRTNALVALGAAGFMVFSLLVPHEVSPTRVAAQVVTGIGFLGAGIIFRDGFNVHGLNTAATLWCSAALGLMAGFGAWPYAVLALTLSFAGYEGEVMRGAFKGVPKGQLEAARAMGMPRLTMLRRIWLPQALHRALPTLGGEVVLQLKATPLVATITVVDIYAVASRVRQDTFIVYEPLLLLAVVYMAITGVLVLAFRWLEHRVPARVA